MATLSLARSAGDFITLVQLIETAPEDSLPAPSGLRSQLLALLEQLGRGKTSSGASGDEIEEARFALVAWADETILRSSWSGRAEWELNTLQMQLYQTAKAGNEFFDRLAALRPDHSAAREVYSLLLALGFQGQYAGQEAERRALVAHQYDTLRASGRGLDGAREDAVTPQAYELEVDRQRRRGFGLLWSLGLMALGAFAVFALLWVILSVWGGDVPLPRGT